VLAMVPFLGTAAVWVPVCLYLYFVEGRTVPALVLAGYSAVVVSGADNVIKPLVLHGQSNLHPLLALLSVIGGLQALGPIGILVGPMVVVFLQTLLKILQRELLSLDKAGGTRGGLLALLRPQAPPAAVSPADAAVAAQAASVGAETKAPAAPAGNGNGTRPQAEQPQKTQSGSKKRRK
jgi:uncharacterized protein YqgC (DUF456 family)